jgi:hypothetical protein
MDALAKEALIEERKVNSAIRNLTSPREEASPETVEVSVDEQAESATDEGLSVRSGSMSAATKDEE